MTIDAWQLFAGMGGFLLSVALVDLGIAFLERGQREATSEEYEVKDR